MNRNARIYVLSQVQSQDEGREEGLSQTEKMGLP